MANLNYLVAAYLVFWLGTLALLGGLWRRQVVLRRQLHTLEEVTRRIAAVQPEED